MTLIFLLYLLILTVSAVGPEYYVSIDTVNGYPTGSLPSIITSPVELTGKFSAKNAAGHENQYGVIIYWGDGTYTRWHWTDPGNASPYLDWNPLNPNAKDFSGTYDTNPDGAPGKEHNYASEGTYTITVKFFHQQEPGKDSEVAAFSITVHVVVPAISVTKSGPAYAHEGDAITYAYTVSNTGNCPLSDVSVVDDLGITIDYVSGDENGNNLLDLTENWIFHATYTVPTPSGDITNIATATGKASGRTVSDSASWTVSILHPGIKVTKSADKTVAYKGDTITYTIKITNTGDCALYDVELVDTLLGTIWTGVLDVGESRTFTPTYTVKAGDPDPLVNAATASGKDSLGLEVTDYATAQVDLISKKYKLTVHTAGLGTHITNVYDGSNVLGTATDAAPYEGWFDEGSEINLDVDSPVTDSLTRFVFTQWSGDSTGTARPIIMVMDSDKSITANYKTQYYLTTSTNYGTVSPSSGWYDAGSLVEVTATAPSTVDGERYVWLGWTGTGAGSYTGLANPSSITVNGPISEAASWVHQYYLTVTSPYGTAGGEDWYDEGSTAYATITPLIVDGPPGVQYFFSHWSGDASGTASPSAPITMNAPKTAVANWKTRYRVTFDQAGLDETAVGTVITVEGSTKTLGDLPFYMWVDDGASVSYDYESTVSSSASGKRFRLNSVTGPASPIIVTGPTTVTGNYVVQYSVTFTQTGLDNTATGTVVTIGSVTKTKADLPFNDWFDSGTTYFYSNTVSSTVTGKRFRLDGVNGPASPITSPGIVIGGYIPQYTVTFTYLGLDGTATGSVAMVAGVPKTYAELPFTTDWLDHGSSLSFTYSDPVTSLVEGKRFTLTSVSHISPLIVMEPTIVSGNYKTQYYLTVNTNPAEVLTLNPATVSGGGWYDGGDTATVDAIQNVDKAAGQSRYDFRSWTGASPTGEGNKATVIMDAPKTATANYQLQYRVTFYTNPPSGTITVDGMIKNNGESEFYDEGASLTVAASAPADYGFSSWTVTGGVTVADYSMQTTSMNIGGAGSLTANFIVNTVSIIITSNPVTGVGFVKVDGVSYATPVIFSWLIGSTHELEAISIVPGPTGTRYVWTGWSDGGAQSHVYTVPSVSETLTAYFSVQHYLTVISPHDTPGGSGWYDEGATAYATLETGTVVENGVQYVFTGWSGDASGTGLISNPIIMSGPKTAVANWMAEFYTVTFDKSPRQGIIRVDDTVYTSLPVVLHWAPGSSHEVVVPEIEEAGGTRYVFREWSDGSTQASRTIVADTPGAVYIAYYNVQYRLTVYSDYGVTTGSGWYDEGAEAVFSVSPTVVRDESEGIEYSFKGWVGSGAGAYYTGPDNPARVVMTGPVEETAQWEPSMYYLKVVSEYGDPYGSGWYPPNSEARFGVNTPVSHGNGTLRVFLNWSGDISLWEPEGTLLMVKPYTVIAYWDTQYLVVYNTTAPNGVLLSIPRVPQTLPPGFNVYATYYSAGSSVEVGPAPETVYGAEDTRYCFEGWAIDGKHATSNVNLAFTVDKPLNISVAYGTEILLTVNMVGVSQPYTARLTVEKSPAYIFDITPASPFREWVRKDTAVTLTVSSPNRIGHGEWAVFREWSGDAQGFQRTVSLKVSGPTTVNAVFFAVNPVAQSIPYSLLTGIVSIVLSRLIRRRREEEPRERWRYSPTLGIMSLAAVLAVAAVVSSSVAMGYGINVGELPDFTNWAVVFTAIEAVVFLAGTLLATRLAYLRKVEIPAIYPNPYGV